MLIELKINLNLLGHQEDFVFSNSKHTILVAGFGCFTKNQKIIMSDNSIKSISDLKENDSVKSYNLLTGKTENKKIINTFVYDSDCIFNLKLKNGTEINVTPNHKFLYKGQWIQISEILMEKFGNQFLDFQNMQSQARED